MALICRKCYITVFEIAVVSKGLIVENQTTAREFEVGERSGS